MFEDTHSLEHFGVKGMRWGVRRRGAIAVSSDSAETKVLKDRVKVSKTTSILTNQELQMLITRMSLETQYSKLHEQTRTLSLGRRIMTNMGKEMRSMTADMARAEARRRGTIFIKENAGKTLSTAVRDFRGQ